MTLRELFSVKVLTDREWVTVITPDDEYMGRKEEMPNYMLDMEVLRVYEHVYYLTEPTMYRFLVEFYRCGKAIERKYYYRRTELEVVQSMIYQGRFGVYDDYRVLRKEAI